MWAVRLAADRLAGPRLLQCIQRRSLSSAHDCGCAMHELESETLSKTVRLTHLCSAIDLTLRPQVVAVKCDYRKDGRLSSIRRLHGAAAFAPSRAAHNGRSTCDGSLACWVTARRGRCSDITIDTPRTGTHISRRPRRRAAGTCSCRDVRNDPRRWLPAGDDVGIGVAWVAMCGYCNRVVDRRSFLLPCRSNLTRPQ
jgi:hypothetical protein